MDFPICYSSREPGSVSTIVRISKRLFTTQLSQAPFRTTLAWNVGACRPPSHEVLVRRDSVRVKQQCSNSQWRECPEQGGGCVKRIPWNSKRQRLDAHRSAQQSQTINLLIWVHLQGHSYVSNLRYVEVSFKRGDVRKRKQHTSLLDMSTR